MDNSPQSTADCHVVALPYPGRGHINPMLSCLTAVAENSSQIHITVVLTEEWVELLGSASKPPNLRFAAIPNVLPSEQVRGEDPHGFFEAVKSKMKEPVEQLLDHLPVRPIGLIADAFMPWVWDMAARRNTPLLASVWPMSATVFSILYHFDLLVQNGHFPVNLPVNGDDVVDYIPGVPPLRVADLPTVMRNQQMAPQVGHLMPKARSLIFTSIYKLEAPVIDALKQNTTYSIYNMGPISSFLKVKKHIESPTITNNEHDHGYLKWLNLQPSSSVLYISLGSFLSVSAAQMEEIANGLYQSGIRFLWVIRGETPLGLNEMCGEKGLIVPWCDQLCVLCHPSVGGFWSHCGWSSTKEALLAGVPLLTFPLLMDQQTNAKAIVEDWKVGWRVKMEYDEKELAGRDDIADLVGKFMDAENLQRKEITRNAKELKKACESEFAEGESFQINLDGFMESILQLRFSVDSNNLQ